MKNNNQFVKMFQNKNCDYFMQNIYFLRVYCDQSPIYLYTSVSCLFSSFINTAGKIVKMQFFQNINRPNFDAHFIKFFVGESKQ